MSNLEKLELKAAKKRESIKEKQEALKKEMDSLKDIEAEIEYQKGERLLGTINKLNLTSEEFDKFQKCISAGKNNLLEVIDLISKADKKQKEGEKPLYE